MDQKHAVPQEELNPTAASHEVTEQDLDQVAGGTAGAASATEASAANNPLYTPSTSSGSNPLYSGG